MKANYNENLLTYAEWKKIYAENERNRKRKILFFAKQKALGLLMLTLGLLMLQDAELGLFGICLFIPIGIYATFTKKRFFDFRW